MRGILAVVLPAVLATVFQSVEAGTAATAPAKDVRDGKDVLRPYLVIDVSAGPEATSYPVRWLDGVPEGGWTDEYKTSNIVLRLVEPGSYERNYAFFKGGMRRVTLSYPFYLGVFEVTQRQWELVRGAWRFAFTNGTFAATRPADTISYSDIRGKFLGLAWPLSRIVDSGSFLGRLRARTGMSGFDLPTDAQWEYACRAGGTDPCTNLAAIARVQLAEQRRTAQPSKSRPSGAGADEGTAPVGSYLPNAWGFYDMLGNIGEWVRDHYDREAPVPDGEQVDPPGPLSSSEERCIFRGGDYRSRAPWCSPDSIWAHGFGSEHGFRLSCELPPHAFSPAPADAP